MKLDKFVGSKILIRVNNEAYIGVLLKLNGNYVIIENKKQIPIKEEAVEMVMNFEEDRKSVV